MNKKYFQPHTIFLVLALIYGISFLFITPPFQVLDEPHHFYKAYYVSEGHFIPGNNDYYFPKSLLDTTSKFNYLRSPENELNTSDIKVFMNLPLNSNDKVFINISYIAIYPPISYLASAFIITIGKFFDLSPLVLMYLGRIINLLFWILLVFFAIKITPVHKWVFLLVALMPMTLLQAGSLSADSFTIGSAFLTIALFFKFAFVKEKINRKDIIIMFILIFINSLTKQAYALLLLLLFIIPQNKFKNNNKIRILVFTFIGLFTLLFTSIWNFLFINTYKTNPSASLSGQISFILSNPLNFPHVLLTTIISKFEVYLMGFVGILGWLSTPLNIWIMYAYILVLIIVALLDKNEIQVNLKQKSISSLTFLIISVLTFAFIYLTYTPVGLNYIYGVQGRYFIPIIPLFLLIFYNNKTRFNIYEKIINFKLTKNIDIMITAFIIIFLFIAALILFSRYYI